MMKDTNKKKMEASVAPVTPPDSSAKKQKGIKGVLMSKRMRYGSYALVVTAIVVAVAVLVNFLAQTLESSLGMRVDLTDNQLFTLQNETSEYLGRLGKDSSEEYVIHIYGLYQAGAENPTIQEVLRQYTAKNKKIKVEYFDPITNPTKANQFIRNANETLQRESVVVASPDGKKYKVMTQEQLFPDEYDANTSRQYYSLRAEQQITSAMMYVTQEETPVVYFLQGHQEMSSTQASAFRMALEAENYEVTDLNLTMTPDVLELKDTLVIASPRKDISENEREIIKNFLQKGGRAMFLLDVMEEELPNLQSVLYLYDIQFGNHYVVEGDSNHYYSSPILLVPQMGVSTIMDDFRRANIPMLVPQSGFVTLPEMKKTTIEVVPLLTTTTQAFAKASFKSDVSIQKEEGDIDGPFTLGVSVYHNNYQDSIETRFVVFGTSLLLNEQLATNSSNFDVLMRCVSWMDPARESTNIRMRSLQVQQLSITTQAQFDTLWIIVLIVIPVLAFSAAVVVYLKRRHL